MRNSGAVRVSGPARVLLGLLSILVATAVTAVAIIALPYPLTAWACFPAWLLVFLAALFTTTLLLRWIVGRPEAPGTVAGVGAVLVGVAAACLPVTPRLEWTWGAGPAAGDMIRPARNAAWGASRTLFELQADTTAARDSGQGRWRAVADLSELSTSCAHRVRVEVTQPEGAVLDSKTGEPPAGSDGVRLVLRSDDGLTPLAEITFDARQAPAERRWHRLRADVPAGARRLIAEVLPGEAASQNSAGRVCIHAQAPKPIIFGVAWRPPVVRAARAIALAWGFLLLTLLAVGITRRLRPWSGSVAGAQSDAGSVTGAWLAALGAFATACILYYPLVAAKYGFKDDYAWLYLSHHDPHQMREMMFQCGRFLSALLVPFAFGLTDTVAELSYLRACGAIGMAALAAALAVFLQCRGWTRPQAVALGLLICTTPSACLTVSWTQLFTLPMPLFLTLVAFSLQQRIRWALRWKSAAYAVAAALSVTAAFWIYQPCAMFYLLWVILDGLPRPGPGNPHATLASSVRALLIFGAGAMIAYLSIVLQRSPNPRSALASDPLAKIRWFCEQPLQTATALFRLAPCPSISGAVGIVLVLGVVCYFARGQRHAGLALIAMLAALPVVYLPNLMIAHNWPAYRSLFALSALVIVVAGFALRGILAHPAALSGCLVAVAALAVPVFAAQGQTNMTAPQALELRLMQQFLRRASIGQVTAIHVIRPAATDTPTEPALLDEFGLPSTHRVWAPPYFVWAAAQEFADPQRRALGDLPVSGSAEPPSSVAPGVLLIDMRDLKEWRAALD